MLWKTYIGCKHISLRQTVGWAIPVRPPIETTKLGNSDEKPGDHSSSHNGTKTDKIQQEEMEALFIYLWFGKYSCFSHAESMISSDILHPLIQNMQYLILKEWIIFKAA